MLRPKYGARGIVEGRHTAMENERPLVEDGVDPGSFAAEAERLRSDGATVFFAAAEDHPAGLVCVADPVKETTPAAAEVGIAMGTETDVAIESAGVPLLGGDLAGILRARRLSRAVMGNIRQNLFFAVACNAAGVPIAAGVPYPVLAILLSPVIAATAMALSAVSVVGNAVRLRTARIG